MRLLKQVELQERPAGQRARHCSKIVSQQVQQQELQESNFWSKGLAMFKDAGSGASPSGGISPFSNMMARLEKVLPG